MEPPGERFERSISEQEERMKELLDNFKTEMMERFQKQEERIATQDLKITRQSDTISWLEETLAEQKKTIEDQNETIRKIARYPALRDLLRELWTPSPPPQENLLFLRPFIEKGSQVPPPDFWKVVMIPK